MAPKPGHGQKGVKTGSGYGSGAKGSKAGSGGAGAGGDGGGAMATSIVQKKQVGGVSGYVESQVRTLLQELHRQEVQTHHQHHHPGAVSKLAGADGGRTTVAPVDNRTLSAFSVLWDQLLAAGFGAEQIKRMVPELPRVPAPTLETALDWLCLHLPAAELPARFKACGGASAAGNAPVRIVALAQQQQQDQQAGDSAAAMAQEPRGSAWDDSQSEEDIERAAEGSSGAVPGQERGSSGSQEAQGQGDGGGGGGGGGGGMKEWILRYMDERASSDEEGGKAAGSRASTCSSIADFEWEVWGDPREVARRRDERARARLPVEERRRQLADEWGRTKEVAARAKAAGDKARQKDAGLLIRDLKLEMVALGVTEQQLDALLGGGSTAGASGAGGAPGQSSAAAGNVPGGAESASAAAGKKAKSRDKEKEKAGSKGKGKPSEDKSAAGGGKGKKKKEKSTTKEAGSQSEEGEEQEEKARGKGKAKSKHKGKGRRDAASPPPEAEPTPEPEPVPVGSRIRAPEPDDEMVFDSWEDRDTAEAEAQAEAEAEAAPPASERMEPSAAAAPAAVGPPEAACGPEHELRASASGDGGDEAASDGSPVALPDGAEQSAAALERGGDGEEPSEQAATGEAAGEADVPAASSAPTSTTEQARKPAEEDGEAGFALPGLFDDAGDDDASSGAVQAPPSALLKAAAAAGPEPWGEYGNARGGAGAGKGAKRTGKGATAAAAVPPEAPRTPRALLSQLCQKQAWSQPRYERLPVASAGTFRYNVVLDLGPARGLAKKRNLYGIRIYSVPSQQQASAGGEVVTSAWPDSASAQDAAAARALYEVSPPLQLQQSLFQSLAAEWRQQWLEWEAADGSAAAAAAAGAAGAAAAAADVMAAAAKQAEEEKLELLRELLSRPAPLLPAPPRAFTVPLRLEAPPPPAPVVPALLDADDVAAGAREGAPQLEQPVAEAAAEETGELTEAAEEEGEALDEERDEHAEPMNHHDGDAVEQEEWEDMVAFGQSQLVEAEAEVEQGQEQPQQLQQQLQDVREEGAEAAQDGGAQQASTAGTQAEGDRDGPSAGSVPAGAQTEAVEPVGAADAALLAAMQRWQSSPAGRAMAEARSALPIAAIRQELMAALAEGDVVVVSGDTGCGKTTQVPQYLLEDAVAGGVGSRTHVVVTQPRRIAAISVAERVADERGEPPPGTPGPASTTGYHVRLGAAVTRHTRLTFCTTGILLRRLAGDPSLRGVSHVVVDEVHERSLQSDFLIALLRDLLVLRRVQRAEAAAAGGPGEAAAAPGPLKVVLMSATLDAKLFANYFGGCPVLHASGRTFPVQRLFLEDVYELTGYRLASDAPAALRRHGPGAAQLYAQRHAGGSRSQRDLVSRGFGDDEALAAPLNPDFDPELYGDRPLHVRRNLARVDEQRVDYDLLEALISHIDATTEPGAVLVFLPGIGEINQLYDRLTAQRAYSTRGAAGGARCVVLPLHSAVPPAGQRAALRPPPPGLRKVVLATNIAETSLTIEDVVAVVDTGRHKERRFNPARSMSMLVEDWVSAASAQQRAGRAGRVRPGVSYATYTKERFERGLRRYGAPEITRVPLEELVLQILLMGLGPVSDFLSRVLEPPQPRAVTAALEVLRQVGALEPPGAAACASAAAGAPAWAPQPHPGQQQAATAAEREVLSPLGRQLALLPVAPRLGKLLVLGALLGCLSPAVTIAASMSHKSPFLTPTDDRGGAERARRALAAPGAEGIAAGQQSDHLLLVAAYELWRVAASPKYGGGAKAAAQAAKRHFLHLQTLEQLSEMRCQLAAMLADAKLVSPGVRGGGGGGYGDGEGGGGGGKAALASAAVWLDDPRAPWNKFARDPLVVKAVLCAALCPAIAVMGEDSSPTSPPRWSDAAPGAGAGEEVFVHPSSVVASLTTPQLQYPYLVYLEKVKTTRLFLRDVTAVSPLSLMLFGNSMSVLHSEGAVVVGSGGGSGTGAGGGVRVACRAQTAVLVKHLRGALNRLLERQYVGTGQGGGGQQVAEAVVATVRHMLREEDEQRAVAARLS